MNQSDAFDALIDAGAALLEIPVQEAWRDAIKLHLGISFAQARLVLEFEQPDEADPAPVFCA